MVDWLLVGMRCWLDCTWTRRLGHSVGGKQRQCDTRHTYGKKETRADVGCSFIGLVYFPPRRKLCLTLEFTSWESLLSVSRANFYSATRIDKL